jgi:hypothetical protein
VDSSRPVHDRGLRLNELRERNMSRLNRRARLLKITSEMLSYRLGHLNILCVIGSWLITYMLARMFCRVSRRRSAQRHVRHCRRNYICASLPLRAKCRHCPLLSGRYLEFGIWFLRFGRGGSVASLDLSFALASGGSWSALASSALTCQI